MERLAIFVNDATYARRFLAPLLSGPDSSACAIVLCPPKLSHRIGKWLSNRQRQQWQRTWADRTRQQLEDLLPAESRSRLDWVVAGPRLQETVSTLRRQLGTDLKVLDIRHQHIGQQLAPADADGRPVADDRWKAPVAVGSSLSAVLALVD